MWRYTNPVRIEFGVDSFAGLPGLIGKRRYALITYGEPFFDELSARLEKTAGAPALTIRNVAPNPDYRLLAEQTSRFAEADATARGDRCPRRRLGDRLRQGVRGRGRRLPDGSRHSSKPRKERNCCRRPRLSPCRPPPAPAAKSPAGARCGTRPPARNIRWPGRISIPPTPWWIRA